MSKERFIDCGFTALSPNDGIYTEYTREETADIVKTLSGIIYFDIVTEDSIFLDAIFKKAVGAKDFAEDDDDSVDAFDHLDFDQFDVHQFPRSFEKNHKAAYDIFRVTLLDKHSIAHYVYVVIDVIITHCEGKSEGVEEYELRGISFPMPNLVPEYSWCNDEKNWFFWSDKAQDFNKEKECAM